MRSICLVLWNRQCVAILLLLAGPLTGSAADTTWNGGVGSWDNVSLWSNGVPTSADSATVRNGTARVATGVSGSYGLLYASGGSTVVVEGGTLSGGSAYVNFGHAQVTSGTWASSELYVGDVGTGSLDIEGGYVTSLLTRVGNQAGSSGTVKVTGGTWESVNDLLLGNEGRGSMEIDGGFVRFTSSYLGVGEATMGAARVTSGAWQTFNLVVGLSDGAQGYLNVDGGLILTYDSSLGSLVGSRGIANVTGGSWSNSDELYIGSRGMGSLNVTNGTVSNTIGHIGRHVGSTGSATISGGTWTNTDSLNVGNEGSGTLSVTDNGVVSAGFGSGLVTLAAGMGSTGVLNLGDGGIAGTIQAAGITGGAGLATVNFNHTGSLSWSTMIMGSIAVNKLGAGTTTLTGNHGFTYTGPTTVHSGSLILDISITSDVTVKNGAIFGGDGVVEGGIFLEAGAKLAPIDCFDADSLFWNAGAKIVITLGESGYSDIIELSDGFDKVGLGQFEFEFLDAGWEVGEIYTLVVFDSTTFDEADFGIANEGEFDGFFSLDDNVLTFEVIAVPEPSGGILVAAGMLAPLLRRRWNSHDNAT